MHPEFISSDRLRKYFDGTIYIDHTLQIDILQNHSVKNILSVSTLVSGKSLKHVYV